MTIARELVRRGFREDNLIPIGRNPTDDEFAEGLSCLNGFLLSTYGHELGEPMRDWLAPVPQRTAPVAANFPQLPAPQLLDAGTLPGLAGILAAAVWPYPPPNCRIVWGGNDLRVFMPENPRPGSRIGLVQGSGARDDPPPGGVLTLDGNGRRLEAALGVAQDTADFIDPVEPRQWFYRADLGTWLLIQPVTLDDDFPFPPEYDDFWICALSMRLAPRYAKTIQQGTSGTMARMLTKIRAEFRQSAPTIYGSENIPRSYQSYAPSRWSW